MKNLLRVLLLASMITTPAYALDSRKSDSVLCRGAYDVGSGWKDFEFSSIKLNGKMKDYVILEATGPAGKMKMTYRSQGEIPQNPGQTTDAAVRISYTDSKGNEFAVGVGGMGGGGLDGDERMLAYWHANRGNIALLYCLYE